MIAFAKTDRMIETTAPTMANEASDRQRFTMPAVAPPPTPPAKRPVSQARLEANRRNAQKSRGPRTVKGKERARANALKHGLFLKVLPRSQNPLLVSSKDYELLTQQLLEDFQPKTQLEVTLVESLAFDLMRLRHIYALEATFWDDGSRPTVSEHGALEGLSVYLRKKTEADYEMDRTLLTRLVHAVTEGRDEPFTEEETTHVVETIQRRFDQWKFSIHWATECIQNTVRQLTAEQDEAKLKVLRERLEKNQGQLKTTLEEEEAQGAVAHGVDRVETLQEFVRHPSAMQPELRQRWQGTLTDMVLRTAQRLGDIDGCNRTLARMRIQRLQAMLLQTPRLELMGRYEAMVRRNIDRTLHQLQMVRHDLFTAPHDGFVP